MAIDCDKEANKPLCSVYGIQVCAAVVGWALRGAVLVSTLLLPPHC